MVHHRIGLVVFLLLLVSGVATAFVPAPDTLLPAGIDYSGYRIYIRKVSVEKQKGKEFLLNMEVINTGKRPISFGPGFPARYLQTRFDESLSNSGLLPLGLQVREALLNSRESFEVGEWKKDLQFLVNADVTVEYQKLTKDNFERISSTIQRRSSPTSGDDQSHTSAFAKTSNACVDLTLSEVKVLQQNKKNATVQLTISNGGSTDFPLENVNTGLSLTMFVSGSPRLSSSSERIKQVNLAERLASHGQASLLQGENIVLVERIDITKATRYTAVLIAQLDSGQVIEECSETNNEGHALLFE